MAALLALVTVGAVLAVDPVAAAATPVAATSRIAVAATPVAATTPAAPTDTDRDGLGDRFETRFGLDPTRRDTDGDGIADGSEDADGDGLSALGEQLAGTSPRRVDTDRDGLPDGQEDADGDGVDNAHQQDRRPLPAPLHPGLGHARLDQPASWYDGCHGKPTDADARPCDYGDPAGARTIVLLGDSHAAQWLPAFDRAGRLAHWRVVSITHSGCPAADLVQSDATVGPLCGAWRQAALDWVVAHPPDLVVLVSGRLFQLLDADGAPLPPEGAIAAWAAATARTVSRLAGLPVLDLGDTPHARFDIVGCLWIHRFMAPCTTPRRQGVLAAWDAAEGSTVEALGAGFRPTGPLVCPYDPCPVVDGDILMWRDGHHLTASYSRALMPSIRAILADALTTLGPAHALRPDRRDRPHRPGRHHPHHRARHGGRSSP